MRLLPLLAALLAILAAVPAPSQAQTVEQEYSRLNADRAHRLGVQQYRMQNYDLALRHFEKAVALAPDVEPYRHSLTLTKQRIAAVKANQRALQDQMNRARKSMTVDEATPNMPSDEDLTGREPGGPTGAAPGPGRGRDGLPPNSARGGNPFDEESVLPGVGIRDANRDLHLGGGGEQLGQPSDLPIAGSGISDLPIGAMPPEPRRPTRPDIGALAPEAPPAPTSGEGSMFPFLDRPAEAPSMRARGRTSGDGPDAGGPNLDTPGTLP